MKRVLEDVGHQNLNGSAVKRALESMKDFGANRMAKVIFGPEDCGGAQEYALYQVQNEKIIGLSDRQQGPVLVSYKRRYGAAAVT
jgi:hypothetical protein